MENTSRDWSSLPADLINKIAELHPLPLRIWLRMVCKSWCSAIAPVNIPTPWLLLPGDGPEFGEYTDSFTFYSVLSNTTFKCPFPRNLDLSYLHCVGSCEGWLILCDPYFDLCVVNPLTGLGKPLPPFSSSKNFKFEYTRADDGTEVLAGFRDRRFCGPEGQRLHNFDRRECYIKKVVFSECPGSEDFVAVALFGDGMLAALRGKGTVWFSLSTHLKKIVVDIFYYFDGFWGLTPQADIIHIDFTRDSTWDYVELKIPYEPVYNTHKFTAFDSDGNVYLILRNGDFQMDTDGKKKFHTRDLTIMKQNPWEPIGEGMTHQQWVPAEDLNGHSLYVGNNNGFYLLTEESQTMRKNCVYVTGILSKDEIFDMGVYDMEKKSFESIYPTDTEVNGSQPPPIWFEPRLIY